jgi:hypothetical protein
MAEAGRSGLSITLQAFVARNSPQGYFIGFANRFTSGRSLKLTAFVAFAGPPDLLSRFAGRASPLRQAQGEEVL